MQKEVNAMVFEGGGTLGVAYGAALLAFESAYPPGYIKSSIKRYAGSSVGSIVAATLAAGGTPQFIYDIMMSLDFSKFEDGTWGVIGDAYRLYEEYGVYKGDVLEHFIEGHLKWLTGLARCTFSQLYTLNGNDLVITGTSVNRRITVYFNRFSHPDMPISTAVRISVGYPFLFRAYPYMGELWADGGILDNYPLGVFDYPPYNNTGSPMMTTLGFKLVSMGDTDSYMNIGQLYQDQNLPAPLPIGGLVDYLSTIFNALYDAEQRGWAIPEDAKRTVSIDTTGFSALNFNLSVADKQKLADAGRAAFTSWLAV